MPLTLKIVSKQRHILGADSTRVFSVHGGSIGRAPDNDWVLPDPDRYISGHHAAIDYRGGAYYLRDNSTNGVYVNQSDQPVGRGAPIRLYDGDELRMGDYVFEVIAAHPNGPWSEPARLQFSIAPFLWQRPAFWVAGALMLGLLVMGFQGGLGAHVFALLIGGCLAAGYALLGAGWLIIKTEGEVQLKAVRWARIALWFTALGIVAISLATPLLSSRIFDKWFALPYVVMLAPVPLVTAALFFIVERSLRRLPTRLAEGNEYGAWVPFGATIGIFLLAFYGLAYSLFPYLIVEQVTIWDAAAAPESLMIIFVGAVIVLPMIIGYTVFAYRVFGGKARTLSYD